MSKEVKVHPAADLFPMMDKDELQKLAADIKKDCQRFPITLWKKDGSVLDGRNRLAACGIADVKPKTDLYDGNDPVGFIISANIHRRHLTSNQKRELVAKLLKFNPEKSDRQIAAEVKVDHKTVAKERHKKEGCGEIPHVTKRADAKGRNQPASKPKIVKLAVTNLPPEPKVVQVEITAEQRRAVNVELEHINDGDRKSVRALAEFKVACKSWLPKLNRDHLQEAIRYCGTFATASSEVPQPKAVH
jgi:hypothetical protein